MLIQVKAAWPPFLENDFNMSRDQSVCLSPLASTDQRLPKERQSMRIQLFATLSIGLLSAACQAPTGQYVPSSGATARYGAPYVSSEQACADYGFTAGSAAYNRCVASERAARASGPVPATYAEAQLNADARAACASYGLVAGSVGYDRCVSNEINARRYREGMTQPAPAYRTDQYGNRFDSEGYRVDANGYRISPQPVYSTQPAYSPQPVYAPQPVYSNPPQTTGQQVFRDEFGYRYDAQGNRLDSNGRIISPQSKTP
ncbi:MAG: hypothetical protein ACXWKQ_17070 [Reyranella sp.]